MECIKLSLKKKKLLDQKALCAITQNYAITQKLLMDVLSNLLCQLETCLRSLTAIFNLKATFVELHFPILKKHL